MTRKRVSLAIILFLCYFCFWLAPGGASVDKASANSKETLSNLLAGYAWGADVQGKPLAEAPEEDIRRIQSLLQVLGYDCGGVDGIAGPNTERAVRGFMQDRGEGRLPVISPKLSDRTELRINIPEFTLCLVEKGKVVRQFDIAVGTPYEQTPTGSFGIFAKVENPTWFPGSGFSDKTPVPPGPDNPLGTRWMEFAPSYGIHGTNKDWDIRYPVSGGCIRMHDEEARELFKLVDIGTPVIIMYETLKVSEKPDGLYLKVFPDIYRKHTSTPEQLRQLYEPYVAAGYKLLAGNALIPKEADEIYEVKIAVRPAPLPAGQEKAAQPRL